MSTVSVIYTPLWFDHCTRHAAQRSFYIQPSPLAFCKSAGSIYFETEDEHFVNDTAVAEMRFNVLPRGGPI